jgi:Aminotransferase class I and II
MSRFFCLFVSGVSRDRSTLPAESIMSYQYETDEFRCRTTAAHERKHRRLLAARARGAWTETTGGRVVSVAPLPDFVFPLDKTLAAITPQTRLIFLTSPGNPTGMVVPRQALHAIARRLPAGALLMLDEAYADFSNEHFLDELPRWPNVVVGRTFSKSHGLGGVRIAR